MIELDQIKKEYPGFQLNCSMLIEKGLVTGLIGKNGSGKSTIYKAILDVIALDGGSIQVFGKDHKNLDKRNIGVVFADSFYSSYLKIKDIRKILKNSYPEFDESYFNAKIHQYQLPEDKDIRSFSFGMKSKLKVICALCHNAKLLLLDEPTLGLDVIARDEILDLLREFMEKDEENTILISSHISNDLETLCDCIYMIDDGKILLHEDLDVLLSQYAILKVNETQMNALDLNYIIKKKKESYGYSLLTNQKQFYLENYPNIVLENNSLDDLIYIMIKGESL
ncbi:MAG: ATP-binding cassette domain-containing protein [Floccifex sp.]